MDGAAPILRARLSSMGLSDAQINGLIEILLDNMRRAPVYKLAELKSKILVWIEAVNLMDPRGSKAVESAWDSACGSIILDALKIPEVISYALQETITSAIYTLDAGVIMKKPKYIQRRRNEIDRSAVRRFLV